MKMEKLLLLKRKKNLMKRKKLMMIKKMSNNKMISWMILKLQMSISSSVLNKETLIANHQALKISSTHLHKSKRLFLSPTNLSFQAMWSQIKMSKSICVLLNLLLLSIQSLKIIPLVLSLDQLWKSTIRKLMIIGVR